MTNLQAAVALAQVERIDELVARRRSTPRATRRARRNRRDHACARSSTAGSAGCSACSSTSTVRHRPRQLRERSRRAGVETRTLLRADPPAADLPQRVRRPALPGGRAARGDRAVPSLGPQSLGDDIAYVADAVRSSPRARRRHAERRVELGQPGDHPLSREVLLMPLVPALGQGRASLRILQQGCDRVAERTHASGRDE